MKTKTLNIGLVFITLATLTMTPLLGSDASLAALTLLIVMDPLGNIPNFMAALKNVPEARRRGIILRECLFALGILLAVFAGGRAFMAIFGLSAEALRIR